MWPNVSDQNLDGELVSGLVDILDQEDEKQYLLAAFKGFVTEVRGFSWVSLFTRIHDVFNQKKQRREIPDLIPSSKFLMSPLYGMKRSKRGPGMGLWSMIHP